MNAWWTSQQVRRLCLVLGATLGSTLAVLICAVRVFVETAGVVC